MIRRWLDRLKGAPKAPQQWRLLVDAQELATLRHPLPDDMFCTSFEIVPSTSPPDDRISNDDFWLGGRLAVGRRRHGSPSPASHRIGLWTSGRSLSSRPSRPGRVATR
jgi:hypothetical protein